MGVCSAMCDALLPHRLYPINVLCPFPRQEYWSEFPCPPPEDLPKPGIIESAFLVFPAFAGGSSNTDPLAKCYMNISIYTSVSDIYLGQRESASPTQPHSHVPHKAGF